MNKTEFKFFTIADWQEEEEYLSLMHKNGWRLKKIGFMDYHFEKCEPENVTYRLDYNKASVNDKEGYLQMFKDCGWEYIFNKFGYSYFRKKEEPGDKEREIFSDSRSKIEMMERVIKSRGIILGLLYIVEIFFLVFSLGQVAAGRTAYIAEFLIYSFLTVLYTGMFIKMYRKYKEIKN